MNIRLLILIVLAIWFSACTHSHEEDAHSGHEEPKVSYTAYSADFEVFAEADAFVAGDTANILAHFSHIPSFKALDSGRVTVVLDIQGKEVRRTLEKPARKGIYSFDIVPVQSGTGSLRFEIESGGSKKELLVNQVSVFTTETEADEDAESRMVSRTNTSIFTKEQSWKIDFATAHPRMEPFGQVLKTTALVSASQGSEVVVAAKTAGTVAFNAGWVLEGREVSAGQVLFTVSGGSLDDNDISVKYAAAASDFEKAKADFERATLLQKDKIIAGKDYLAAKNQFEHAKAVFENLSRNFNAGGQPVKSPQTGFIKQVFVKNGGFVEAGQPVAVISQSKSLLLTAEVPVKYAPMLANIKTAGIRTIQDGNTYSLEQLNGKVVSYGKAANSDNFLIPVVLQVENNGSLVSGSFVDIWLRMFSTDQALVVPNSSLMEEQGNFFVWVQITPELFEKREVRCKGTDGINTEILSGITSHDRIVTRGAMLIKLAQATGTLDAHSGHVH